MEGGVPADDLKERKKIFRPALDNRFPFRYDKEQTNFVQAMKKRSTSPGANREDCPPAERQSRRAADGSSFGAGMVNDKSSCPRVVPLQTNEMPDFRQ